MNNNLITIGFHKGDADFEISGKLTKLDYKQMNELRAMIVVAIGVAEDMWRREIERQNPPSQTLTPNPTT